MSRSEKDTSRTTSHEIGDVFDEMSDQYTDVMDHMVPHYRKLMESMMAFLPKNFNPASILDLGCGNGNVSALSSSLFPDAHHHLIDASDEMLEQCKLRFSGDTMTYEQNLFQNINLPVERYDLVMASFSLHHLSAEEKQEIFNVLYASMNPKGVLTCADLFVNKGSKEHGKLLKDWKAFVFNSGKTQEDWDWLKDHYEKYDQPNAYSDQRKWLLEAGFATVELSWSDGHWGCFHARKE